MSTDLIEARVECFFLRHSVVRRLFRNDLTSSDKAELMIFVTPKIISEVLALTR
jgi:hypothetical protein